MNLFVGLKTPKNQKPEPTASKEPTQKSRKENADPAAGPDARIGEKTSEITSASVYSIV